MGTDEHGRSRRCAASALALFAGVVLTLLYNWRLLTAIGPDRTTIVAGDFWDVHFPFHAFTATAWQHGGPPMWTEAINGGHPALADSQFGAFYPPTMLAAWLLHRAPYTPEVLIRQAIAHQVVAFIGAYLLFFWLPRAPFPIGREATPPDGAGRAAHFSGVAGAFVGGACFAFGGYMTSYPIQQTVILEVATWLPWVLLGVDLAVTSASPAWIALAALPITLATLAGHPQTLLYVLYAGAGLWAWRSVQAACALPRVRAVRHTVAGAAPIALGLALASVQLFPTLELVPRSVRAHPGFSYLSSGFAPHELAGVLLRGGFGGAAPLYLGIIVLGLVGLSCLDRRRDDTRGYWLLLTAFAVLLSLGAQSFLFDLLYLVAPGFALFRGSERGIVLLAIGVAALAAHGTRFVIDSWDSPEVRLRLVPVVPWAGTMAGLVTLLGLAFSGWPVTGPGAGWGMAERDAWFWLIVIVALGGALAIVWWRRAVPLPIWTFLLASTLLLDLFSAHPMINLRSSTTANPDAPPALIEPILADLARPFRVSTEGMLPGDGNEGLLSGLDDVVGNTPLELKVVADLQLAEADHQVSELQRLALFDVRYIVTKRLFPTADRRFTLLGTSGSIHLYRLAASATLPRAWIVHGSVTAGHGGNLATLGTIDPRSTALLELSTNLPRSGPALPGETVTYVRYGPNRSTLRAMLERPGLLLLGEVWYPGWKVTVDGRPARFLRADDAFRAVALSPGTHTIVVWYAPASYRLGRLVTAAAGCVWTLLLVVGLATAGWRRYRVALAAPANS